ncbi:SusC/RagA family TonB-linked outer membrane protein [Leeuwenhoekiella sp. W20_SRS_FM14]|uniref:SusC/RagA family TonB-linked outer membrane protein n=1 Tax=Leeuwenhoekiella sp. W20_SRS_FM14 TaxID=3240270 RepID=UPI003F99CDD2
MKTRLHGFLTLLLVLIMQISFAQTKTVSGTVTDDTGVPLPGVNVVVKGTTQGTQTDFDGKFSISASEGAVIVFSYVGFANKSQTVGSSNTMNIVLEQGEQLDEIILTALGLEKKKDEDLSSSTTISTDEISKSGETGLIQGLSGKTSGVNITRNSGDPGAGAYIQIRGQNTVLGSASPLIVLDGVIISNTSVGGGTDGVVQQSRLNDINPEDIANVTVLKGAAAASIYGTGAANGVIIIKTKRGTGSGGKNVSVDFRSSVSFDRVNVEFDKQGKFGQGNNGVFQRNTGNSWGDKISDRAGGADLVNTSGQYFEADSGNLYYPITEKRSREVFNNSNRDQVFGTGVTIDNSVSLGYATDNTNTLFSVSDLDQQGIINGQSSYDRQTLRFNHEARISEKFMARVNTSYSKITSKRIQQGSNLNGLYLGYLRTAPDFDNRDYKGTYFNSAGTSFLNAHRGYRNDLGSAAPVYNNPGWTINEQDNPNDVERFIINPEINWKILDNVSLTGRYGLDYYSDTRETFFPVNSAAGLATGAYFRNTIQEKQQTYNIFLNGNNIITSDINFNWLAGAQFEENDYSNLGGSSTIFTNPFVDDLRIFGNAEASNETPTLFKQLTRKSGAYGSVNFDLYNQVFLEATGRIERASSLQSSTFYPSFSAGWAFSENIDDKSILSFGKLRASYGEVGIEPIPYRSLTTFSPGGVASSWGDALFASVYGNPFTRSGIQGNPDLKVERIKEYEIGTDLRFINNRITLGATYYSRTTEDALLPIDVPSSTGFNQVLKNAAEISNKGLELDLGLNIIRTEDIKWDVNVNYSHNRNIVESLSGVQSYFLNGFTGTSSRVVEGEPFGSLWGVAFARDEAGDLILDANGFPTASNQEGVIGDPNPDWRGGVSTSLSVKGFTLSALIETSQGGDIWGGSNGVLNTFGVSPITANESTSTTPLTTYSGSTIPANTTFRGNIQDFGGGPVALTQDWYGTLGGGFGAVGEQFIEDGSWTRLRELSLFYAIPSNAVEKIGLRSIELGVTGRNLILWTDVEGFDPETNLTGASKGRGLEYFNNPGTKSYLFTLKISY